MKEGLTSSIWNKKRHTYRQWEIWWDVIHGIGFMELDSWMRRDFDEQLGKVFHDRKRWTHWNEFSYKNWFSIHCNRSWCV